MLVSMKEILLQARAGHYGVPAPNVFDQRSIDACIRTAEEKKSPVILNIAYMEGFDIGFLASYSAGKARETEVSVAVNLDHGGSYEHIVKALASEFTSVMIDRSSKSFEENLEQTKEIVKIAHALGKSVEAELGHVGNNVGIDVESNMGQVIETDEERRKFMTKVPDAVKFVEKTGVDCLAVAIGTVHGLYPKGFLPKLDFDLLAELREALPVPLVIHGGSGSGDENLARACREGVCKVNVFSDLTKNGRDYAAQGDMKFKNPVENMMPTVTSFYIGYSDMLAHYFELLGSAGKA